MASGGTGAVYRARVVDPAANGDFPPTVAVKILHPHLVSNACHRDVFLKEARIARLVPHPGAVRVFDASVSSDGTAYLVLELLEGRSLQDGLVGWGDLLLDEVVRVVRGVLEVLAVAHVRGVVHCDVKPENVFVMSDGTVKLLDFGVARVTGEARRTGIAGTLAFMAPEQARGDWAAVDERSDVWSVGATFYTLITGAPLAPGAEPQLPETVPTLLADVVRRALEPARERRWRDAGAMLEAFAAAAKRSGIPRSSRTLPEVEDDESAFTLVVAPYPVALDAIAPASSRPPPPTRRRSRVLYGALVIAAAGLLGAALAVAVTGDAPIEQSTGARMPKPMSSTATTSADLR